MKKAIILLLISVLLLIVSRLGISVLPLGFLEKAFSFRLGLARQEDELGRLRQEKLALLARLVDQEKLLAENEALRIQLSAKKPDLLRKTTQKLLPASVLGVTNFLILDKGREDGVKEGQTVIFKNMLVGQVVATSSHRSRVNLPISSQSKIPAKTERGTLGIVVGQDGGMLFDHVAISEMLEEKDLVFTKGSFTSLQEEVGDGLLPDFFIGEVGKVRKSEASLFQQAELRGPLDVKRLTTVFIVL